MSTQQQKILLDWITISKGIGIIFVVIGHFIPKGITPEYYIHIKNLIYTFHMPLFFLLAGFLYNYKKYNYNELVYNKIKRLIYPFISIALFFFIIKFSAGFFFQMKHTMTLEHIFIILIDPKESYMSLLWFVYALFLIFITYPLIRRYISNNFIILAIFIVINILFAYKNILYTHTILGDVFENIPFFIGGIILQEYKRVKDIMINGKPITIFINSILFLIPYWFMSDIKEVYYIQFILGVIGSFLVFNISYFISTYSEKNIFKVTLTYIGISSMTIYLFHNLFLGMVKIVFLQILKGLPISFETIAIIAIILGITLPMILEKKFFIKYTIFRKYLLGVK